MYAVKYGYDISPSAELKALGMTNMGGSIFQSFLVMGAFGRSAVNESSGAKSQLSGVVATFVVVLLLLCIMPALFYLPKVCAAPLTKHCIHHTLSEFAHHAVTCCLNTL